MMYCNQGTQSSGGSAFPVGTTCTLSKRLYSMSQRNGSKLRQMMTESA
jgi:hypothetical protein